MTSFFHSDMVFALPVSFRIGSGFILICFAGLALCLHIFSCILVAVRRAALREKQASMPPEADGVSVLCAVHGKRGAVAEMEQSLSSAFSMQHDPKEIIICDCEGIRSPMADSIAPNPAIAVIHAVREQTSSVPSLFIRYETAYRSAHQNGAEEQDNSERQAKPNKQECSVFLKAWRSARYDFIAALSADTVPAPALIRQCFALRRKAGKQQQPTGLVCSALWAVSAEDSRARLEAAFLNSWWTRRLLAAESLGCGVAQSGVQFWHYAGINAAGGISVFADAAQRYGSAWAATEILRRQGKKIRLTALPVPLPIKRDLSFYNSFWEKPLADLPIIPNRLKLWARSGRFSVLAKQVARLRFYRRFLPRCFFIEPLIGAALPFAAIGFACFCGIISWLSAVMFIGAWYGAEIVFLRVFHRRIVKGTNLHGNRDAADKAQRAKLLLQIALFLPIRDACLPFLWLYALLFPKNNPAAQPKE